MGCHSTRGDTCQQWFRKGQFTDSIYCRREENWEACSKVWPAIEEVGARGAMLAFIHDNSA